MGELDILKYTVKIRRTLIDRFAQKTIWRKFYHGQNTNRTESCIFDVCNRNGSRYGNYGIMQIR